MHNGNAREFFGTVASRGREPRLAEATGTWQFDVDGAGTWSVKVDHGALSVVEGRPPDAPTARLQLTEAELVRLANGDGHENALTGLLRGVVHVGGDLRFAQKLFSIMPVPDDWRDVR
jgi:hypothetical protein